MLFAARGGEQANRVGVLVSAHGNAQVIVLLSDDPRHRAGEGRCVPPLVLFAGAVVHVAAGIEQNSGRQLFFRLLLAQDQSVLSRGGSPIQAPQVVAGHVGTMIAKLEAESGPLRTVSTVAPTRSARWTGDDGAGAARR